MSVIALLWAITSTSFAIDSAVAIPVLSRGLIVESMNHSDDGKYYPEVADVNYWLAHHRSRHFGRIYTRAFGFSPLPSPRELGDLLADYWPSAYSLSSNSLLATDGHRSISTSATTRSHGDQSGADHGEDFNRAAYETAGGGGDAAGEGEAK